MNDVYRIVVCGPMSEKFLVDVDGVEFVLSSNARAYLVSELQRVAPIFAGLPVFLEHTEGADRSRLVMGQKGRVGRLTRAWWAPEEREIRGELEVTSDYWRRVFATAAGRHEWAFSWDVDTSGPIAKSGLGVNLQITRLFSVDLVPVEHCAFGGRFADMTFTEELLQAKEDHFDYMLELQRKEQHAEK